MFVYYFDQILYSQINIFKKKPDFSQLIVHTKQYISFMSECTNKKADKKTFSSLDAKYILTSTFQQITIPPLVTLNCEYSNSWLCFNDNLGVSEAGEGRWKSHSVVWLIWGFPGHLRLGDPGSGGRRHNISAGNQVQQHRDEPEQHQPHIHRLPDLPDQLEPKPLIHTIINKSSDVLGHSQKLNDNMCFL